ncbi:YihY/virulence factor BrkB family protein [Arhodomonas sp. SL1]|uniref:YihY/virulence factor BrkB family protein n=1 Tax=Arhodomonas sp. SL1 TaxID=3425691 RepID=UPI003F8836E9
MSLKARLRGAGSRQWAAWIATTVRRLAAFGRRVLRDFMANRGILLAGGVGYNVLLSVVPFFAVCTAVLSTVVDQARLVTTVRTQTQFLAPGYAGIVADAVEEFLETPAVLGVISFLVLLFFSSLAFRMLEDAIAIIFHRHKPSQHRSLWFSAILPYLYVVALSLGILTLTVVGAVVDALSGRLISVLGMEWTLERAPTAVLYVFGFLGIALLFASVYKVLPVVKVSLRRALVGGFVAAALWELTLQAVMYYFDNISLVNAIYGSFATVIVVLLSLELGAVILLLGAQVIAELERSAEAGLPWYRAPEDRPPPHGSP